MQELRINGEIRKFPTGWHEVSFKDYLAISNKNIASAISHYSGIPEGSFDQLDPGSLEILVSVLAFLNEPMPEQTPENILEPSANGIGKAELTLMVLRTLQDPVASAPYAYAIYLREKEYKGSLAFVQGFPEEVVAKVREMNAVHVLSTGVYLINKVQELHDKYASAIYKEPSADQLVSGIDKLHKFGFFGTLSQMAKKKFYNYDKVLETPAEVFYLQMTFDAELSDYLFKYPHMMKGVPQA